MIITTRWPPTAPWLFLLIHSTVSEARLECFPLILVAVMGLLCVSYIEFLYPSSRAQPSQKPSQNFTPFVPILHVVHLVNDLSYTPGNLSLVKNLIPPYHEREPDSWLLFSGEKSPRTAKSPRTVVPITFLSAKIEAEQRGDFINKA